MFSLGRPPHHSFWPSPKLRNATQRFIDENKDPKSQIIVTLSGSSLGVDWLTLLFYDGPEKPAIFDGIEGFPTILDNIGEKSFRSFIESFPVNLALM